MTTNELVYAANNSSLADFLPLVKMKTVAAVAAANNDGYSIGYTVQAFSKKYPGIPSDKIFFSRGLDPTIYFDRKQLILFPVRLYGREEMVLSGSLEESTMGTARRAEQLAQSKEYGHLWGAVPSDRLKLELLNLLASEPAPELNNLYEIFADCYQTSDFGFDTLSLDAIKNIFSSKTSSQIQLTQESLAECPDTINIYRGEGDKSTAHDKAASWTLDINVANFFASRLSFEHGIIYAGTVRKTDVLECFTDRNELEIIVPPSAVTVNDIINLGGGDEIKSLVADNGDHFTKYKKMLIHNVEYHVPEGDDHGKLHALRVLFLSTAVAKRIDLISEDELHIVSTAAIWHDCGRGCPGEHGEVGELFYRENAWEVDERAAFLIRWHSMDDNLCEAAVAGLTISEKEKAGLLKMLWVLKDADALDRVRFGIRSLDMTQLRFRKTKELSLVAELTRQGLQL